MSDISESYIIFNGNRYVSSVHIRVFFFPQKKIDMDDFLLVDQIQPN